MAKPDTKVRLSPLGIRNKGNDCFFNSAMQCILSLVELATFYSSASFGKEQHASASLQEFISHFKGGSDAVVPEDFIQKLRGDIKLLNGRQQDSHEFLLILMNLLFKELESDGKEVYGDMNELKDLQSRNFIAETFYGMLQTSVICNMCLKRFKCLHHFSTLSLNVFPNIHESLDFFTKENVLENDNKWTCGNCGMSKSSRHKIDIIDYPKVLIIHLMRFDGGYRKDNRGVDVDGELVLGNSTYMLTGMICHTGVLNSGHYIAYAKRAGGWHCFDDGNVTRITSDPPLRSSNAYLVFYQRK